MPWRDKFVEHLASGNLGGITIGAWLRLLIENRFAISPFCFARALSTTLQTPLNSLMKQVEEVRYGRSIRSAVVMPPLFVIGHWRSGTTHLQQLLVADSRFASPNLYQVFFPHTFLTTEALNAKMIEFFLPRRRGFDNVRQHVRMPHEDEIALCSMSGCTSYLSMVFPRRAAYYDRFLTFREADESEKQRWRHDLEWFLRKLTLKHGKPLILKSPPHTCRIAMLLNMFPDARFVHIHRNPYAVFQSTMRLLDRAMKMTRLQGTNEIDWLERTLRSYREMYDVFFEERPLIPDGRLCEVAFEDLESNPIGQLRRIYETLGLPDFQACERDVRDYSSSLSEYQKNEFAELPSDLRKIVGERWQPSFDEWNYPSS